MKKCSTCQEYKDESEFYTDKSRRDGRGRRCKKCEAQRSRKYWIEKKELYQKGGERHHLRIGRPDNRRGDRHLPGTRRRYKEQNRDRVNAWQRGYNARHSEQRKVETKQYYDEHPEIYIAQKAVQRAIRNKILPPVRECTCVDCGKQARHYHHSSYAEDRRLDVVALCSRCHKLRHMSSQTG